MPLRPGDTAGLAGSRLILPLGEGRADVWIAEASR